MSVKKNEAAKDLWAQIFLRAAQLPDAAMNRPDSQSDEDWDNGVAEALVEAGWSQKEIKGYIAANRERMLVPNTNSAGVAPGLEGTLRKLSDRISQELSAEGATIHEKIEFAIDPKIGVSASLTNVVMTDEAILTVSSFLFRWCGLIARAYTRTLLRDVGYWSGSTASTNEDKLFFLKHPELGLYWSRIFISFAGTGTHAIVPFKPATREEVFLMEQVAWSMEYFTVAHEYGHHMLGHRSVDADPMNQEYEADRFALRVCNRLAMEPFKNIENPYLRTGAGATLMLKSLELLRLFEDDLSAKKVSETHPETLQRIQKIMNRNALQPAQHKMDLEFNGVVLRIMSAVEGLMKELLSSGGGAIVHQIRSSFDDVT